MKNNTFNGFPLLLKSKILNMAYKIPPYFFPGSSPTTSFSSLKLFLSPTIAQGLCIHTFHNSEILYLPFYLIPTQSSDIGAKLFFQERLPWSSSLGHVLLYALKEPDPLFKEHLSQFVLIH